MRRHGIHPIESGDRQDNVKGSRAREQTNGQVERSPRYRTGCVERRCLDQRQELVCQCQTVGPQSADVLIEGPVRLRNGDDLSSVCVQCSAAFQGLVRGEGPIASRNTSCHRGRSEHVTCQSLWAAETQPPRVKPASEVRRDEPGNPRTRTEIRLPPTGGPGPLLCRLSQLGKLRCRSARHWGPNCVPAPLLAPVYACVLLPVNASCVSLLCRVDESLCHCTAVLLSRGMFRFCVGDVTVLRVVSRGFFQCQTVPGVFSSGWEAGRVQVRRSRTEDADVAAANHHGLRAVRRAAEADPWGNSCSQASASQQAGQPASQQASQPQLESVPACQRASMTACQRSGTLACRRSGVPGFPGIIQLGRHPSINHAIMAVGQPPFRHCLHGLQGLQGQHKASTRVAKRAKCGAFRWLRSSAPHTLASSRLTDQTMPSRYLRGSHVCMAGCLAGLLPGPLPAQPPACLTGSQAD